MPPRAVLGFHGSTADMSIEKDHLKAALVEDDDDCSTVAPSDSLCSGTAAASSTAASWDTANLEDLGSCGVLSSAELRAARLRKIHGVSGVSSSKGPSTTAVDGRRQSTDRAPQSALGAQPRGAGRAGSGSLLGYPTSTNSTVSASSAASAKSPGSGVSETARVPLGASVASRGCASKKIASKVNSSARSSAVVHAAGTSPRVHGAQVLAGVGSAAAETATRLPSRRGEQQRSDVAQRKPVVHQETLDAISNEAIAAMGLWQKMPAKNPIVASESDKGASWNVAFDKYEHTLGGVSERPAVENPRRADELKRQLDIQSQKEIKAMGLLESMPARNPVVTETDMGASWHVPFCKREETSSPVGEHAPAGLPHKAAELKHQLDMLSREQIKALGLLESMPANNPVVTQTDMGAAWNLPFGKSEHSLGGVPERAAVQRPHDADDLKRQLDAISREQIKAMGLSESMPAKNPVVTRVTNMGADWNIAFGKQDHTSAAAPSRAQAQQSHKADELKRQLDKLSREQIRDMGLWEFMPARNPVVTQQTDMGASWHISFS